MMVPGPNACLKVACHPNLEHTASLCSIVVKLGIVCNREARGRHAKDMWATKERAAYYVAHAPAIARVVHALTRCRL